MSFKSFYRLFVTTVSSTLGSIFKTDGVAASATNTYYSSKFSAVGGHLSFSLKTTGTLTGTFTMWYSDKEKPALDTDDDWVLAVGPTLTNPAGAATFVKYAADGIEAGWVRIKYVNASGTGNVYGYATREGGV